jgi:hypothetical protein
MTAGKPWYFGRICGVRRADRGSRPAGRWQRRRPARLPRWRRRHPGLEAGMRVCCRDAASARSAAPSGTVSACPAASAIPAVGQQLDDPDLHHHRTRRRAKRRGTSRSARRVPRIPAAAHTQRAGCQRVAAQMVDRGVRSRFSSPSDRQTMGLTRTAICGQRMWCSANQE